LTLIMGIQELRERPCKHEDRRDGRRDRQAADEQNSLRSALHRRISISKRALGSVVIVKLSSLGHAKRSLPCRLSSPPILDARAQARPRERSELMARSANPLVHRDEREIIARN
jgi:hypothetical protein